MRQCRSIWVPRSLTQAVLPGLRAQGWGRRIINISNVSALGVHAERSVRLSDSDVAIGLNTSVGLRMDVPEAPEIVADDF